MLRAWGLQQDSFYQKLDKWFQNFHCDTDKRLAQKLLLNFDYFNSQTVDEKIKQLFKPVKDYLVANNKSELDLLVVIPNEKGDSATRNSYDLIKQWNLAQRQIFEIKNFRQQYLEDKVAIFFNDTHGSGDQILNDIIPKIRDIHCKMFILCLTITTEALRKFNDQNLELTIIPNKASKNVSSIFTELEIDRLKELGRLVYPKHPLGYGGVALLTAYYYQCPNNTLPIVWANGINNVVKGQSYPWNPLFEYRPKRINQDVENYERLKLQMRVEENILSKKNSKYFFVSPIKASHIVNLDLLPPKLTQEISTGNKIGVAKQLEAIYKGYRKEYKENGNPIYIYNKVVDFLFTVETLLPEKSIQIANFYWFLAYLLINSDYSIEVLEQAKAHSQNAINILENAELYDTEIQNLLIKSYWLRALSYKMQGHINDAHRMITDTISELEKENIGDYVDTIYLHRQKVLIEEQKKSYEKLLKGMQQYKYDSIESYYTSKRIFEFAINTRNQKDYDKLFNLTREHYKNAAPQLEQISKFSYWKYLYIYFKYTKKNELANRIFNHLLSGSIEKQLYGQQRTLKSLKEMFNE
ncbi:MAG: hypothetical protein WC209_18350 [Ignavibacteriaceae bacterium]